MLRAIVSLEIMLKRKFHFVFCFCLFVLSGPECVSAFPNGAPVQACDTLSPSPVGHLVAASNCPEPCPFRMEVMEIIGVPNSAGSTEYFCGSLHRTFVLTSDEQTPFRGFFTQSRLTTPSFDPNVGFVGEFSNVFGDALWQTRPCDGSNAGATHTSRIQKTEVDVIWRAPPRQENPPSVTFWFSIVQQRMLYHVQMQGLVLTPNAASCEPRNATFAVTVSQSVIESSGVVSDVACVELIDAGDDVILLEPLSVTLTSIDGSATDTLVFLFCFCWLLCGIDYVSFDEAVTFLPGSPEATTLCVDFIIIDDAVDEPDETFFVTLTSSEADILSNMNLITVLISDDDMPLSFTFTLLDSTVIESQGSVVVAVSANSFPLEVTIVLVSTASVTAIAPDDYIGVTEGVTFLVGDFISQTVEITIIDDILCEILEAFEVRASTTSPGVRINGMEQMDTLRVNIIDNDFASHELIVPQTIEENNGPLQASVRLTGSGVLSTDLTVVLSTVPQSATSPDDFLSRTFITIFPASSSASGGSRQDIQVVIVNDNVFEANETFLVRTTDNNQCSDPAQNSVVVTIKDDDALTGEPVVVGFESTQATVAEGETLESCIVIISGIAESQLVIQIFTIPSTASSGIDFVGTSITVMFAIGNEAGERRCIEIETLCDNAQEGEEVFFLFAIDAGGIPQLMIDSGRQIQRVTIEADVDNILVGFQQLEMTVSEDVGMVLVCVQIISGGPSQEEEIVRVSSTDDSAISCDYTDYNAVSATVTFSAGASVGSKQCVCVSIIDDVKLEETEQFFVSLTTLQPCIGIENDFDVATIMITDNEPPTSVFGFEMSEYRVSEGDGLVEICAVMLSHGPLLQSASFQLIFTDRSAMSPRDYEPMNTVITFPPGSKAGNTLCGSVDIIDDLTVEETERFTVTLESDSETVAVVDDSRSTHIVTIKDDDVACVGLTEMDVIVSESSGEVLACVELQKPSVLSNDSSYILFTQDGTAMASNDYEQQSTLCVFPAGSMAGDTQCLFIPIFDNSIPDGTRSFDVRLTTFDQLVAVLPGEDVLTVTITDNDLPQVKFQRSEYNVLEDDGSVVVCVELVGGPLAGNVAILVQSQSGTAVAGDDFVPVTLSLVLSVGSPSSTTVCIDVTILDDVIPEIDHSFTLELSSSPVSVATVAVGGESTTVTIIDDDESENTLVSFKDRSMVVSEATSDPVMLCVQICPAGQNRTRRDISEGGDVGVRIFTKPGSAEAGVDYVSTSISISTSPDLPRKTSTCAAVSLLDDNALEGDEGFSASLVDLMMTENVTILQGAETLNVIIEDDEVPAVGFQVIESTVNESVARKFACVEILSGGPLPSEAVIEFYTRDGSAVAPDDYEMLVTTLTFREGADGSRPSDAACVGVFIFDDSIPEDTERLSFHIRSLNTSVVRVVEGRAWKHVYIRDNDGVDIGLDRPSYTVMENVGEGDLGLMVCSTVVDTTIDFTVLLIPQDMSAQETVDYRVGTGRMDFFNAPGPQTRCVCIQIINDVCFRGERNFNLTLYCDQEFIRPSAQPVSVLIMEDEDEVENFELRWIMGSPRVSGNSVAADFYVGTGIVSLSCSVTTKTPMDCSSGSVIFTDLNENRRIPFTLSVSATYCNGTTVENALSRRLRIDQSQCASHLINDGVTVSGDMVTVQWQGTGPSEQDQITQFTCIFDGAPEEPCSSVDGFTRSGLSDGEHRLIVRPLPNPLCTRRIGLRVNFIVGN